MNLRFFFTFYYYFCFFLPFIIIIFKTFFQIHGSRLLSSGPKTKWSCWCPDVWGTYMKKDPPHPPACAISCLLGQVVVLLSTWVKHGLFKTFHFFLWFIFQKKHLDKWRMECIKMEQCLEVVLAEMIFYTFIIPYFLSFLKNCLSVSIYAFYSVTCSWHKTRWDE